MDLAYEENLRSLDGGESVLDKDKEKAPKAKRAFSLNKAIRSMVEGTSIVAQPWRTNSGL